ncbi:fibronectin type III domain-containing protein [Dasania marina]|uniref:fibronectin type III domain-containing protein n=1 Tax=Dasania marina TaxID=471499 RepID=UPI0030DAF28B
MEIVTQHATDYQYLLSNGIRVTNPRGNATTIQYLAYGQPEYELATNISSPELVTTVIGYNIFGNKTSVTQGGFENKYIYDGYQRLCKLFRPEVNWSFYDYNVDNMLAWKADGISSNTDVCDLTVVPDSEKVYFNYDYQFGLASTTYPDLTITQKLDGNANVIELNNGLVKLNYDYDSQNNVVLELMSLDDRVYPVERDYDNLGYLTRLQYPSGRVAIYSNNALGKVTSIQNEFNNFISNLITEITYHATGTVNTVELVNGIKYQTTSNIELLPETIEAKKISSGTYINWLQYEYDNNENVININDKLLPEYDIELTYDDLDRLNSATGFWGVGNVDFDMVGNITRKAMGSELLTYNYNETSNRLETVTGNKFYSFIYDNQGNVMDNGSKSFIYNQANQLTNSGPISYTYDGYSRRVKKIKPTGTSYTVYSKAGQLLHQERPTGEVIDHVYLNGQVIARFNNAPSQVKSVLLTANIGEYALTWDVHAEADDYTVEAYSNGAWAEVVKQDSAHYNSTDAGPYRVNACNMKGCGGWATHPALVIPDIPTSLGLPSEIIRDGNVALTWLSSEFTEYYEVETLIPGVENDSSLNQPVYNTSRNLQIASNGSYQFRVRACNDAGCSDWLTSADSVTVLYPPLLPASINVPVSLVTNKTVPVSWDKPVTTTRTELWQQKNNGAWTVVSIALPGTSTSLSGVADGSYAYRVRACNGSESNSCSGWKTSTVVNVEAPFTPAVPTISASQYFISSTSCGIKVNWSQSTGASRYVMQRKNGDGASWVTNVNANKLSYSFTRNNSLPKYYFRVKACNDTHGLCSSYRTMTFSSPPLARCSGDSGGGSGGGKRK